MISETIVALMISAIAIAPLPQPSVIDEVTQTAQTYAMAQANIAEEDIRTCAKLVWGEARGIKSDAEKAAVIWCVLNRLDSGRYGDSIYEVITAPYQFTGYRAGNPVTDELYELAKDVLTRYELEKMGKEEVGRTLPKEYEFFVGYDGRNWFRKTYRDPDPRWDWSLPDPYEEKGE